MDRAGEWQYPDDVELALEKMSKTYLFNRYADRAEPNTRESDIQGWYHHVIVGMSGQVLKELDLLDIANPHSWIFARPHISPEEMLPHDVGFFREIAPPPHWECLKLRRAKKVGGSGPGWFTERYCEWVVVGYFHHTRWWKS